jgi:hypothetical protein
MTRSRRRLERKLMFSREKVLTAYTWSTTRPTVYSWSTEVLHRTWYALFLWLVIIFIAFLLAGAQ